MELFVTLLCLSTVYGNHLTINWTKPSGWKGYMEHPPGAPFSPCPCDMASNFCDPSCCCDEDCDTFPMNTPSCPSSVIEAQAKESVSPHACKYFGLFSPEWHSFFCPVKENSPILGLFYPPEQAIRDFQKYLTVVGQEHYSYQEEAVHISDLEHWPHYALGAHVLVGEDLGGPVVRGALQLPQPVLEGFCVDTFPVHFLEDFSHECPVIMSPGKCESEASLSVASYLQPSDGTTTDQPAGLSQVIGNLSSLNFVNASVQYQWLEDITGFIKVQGVNIPTLLAQSSAADLEGDILPYLDEATDQCHNVVLAVEYHLAWEGPAIVNIAATITLGSVPVFPEPKEDACTTFEEQNPTCVIPPAPWPLPLSATPQVFLIQHFKVQFHHSPTTNASGDASDFTPEEAEMGKLSIPERSGNPGYLLHRPLLAGYVEYNNSTGEENSTNDNLLSVVLNVSTGLYVWRPDESGSCYTLPMEKVTFGVDMFSACLYKWSAVIFCSDLRETLEEALYSLVQAEVISAFGWPNVTNEEDFLPIIFEHHKEDNKTSGSGCDIPSALEYTIIYQNVLEEHSSALAVHQVIGASVRLCYKTLHFGHNFSSGSQLLTSSVVFSHQPRPSGLSRFWEAMEDRWCERGTCWREVLWPWTHGWTGMGWGDQDHPSITLASLLAQSFLALVLLIPPLVLTFTQGFRLSW